MPHSPTDPQQAVSNDLRQHLSSIELGSPISAAGYSWVPLMRREPGPDADLLEEALQSGTASVSEVSDAGQVNSVRVRYSGDKMLLLLSGEQVLGAKQNRVFNASFLVAPGQDVVIPVSCVEKRRWNYEGPAFRESQTTLAGSMRLSSLSRVAHSVETGLGYDSDQTIVWREVDSFLAARGVQSPTASFEDAVASESGELERNFALLKPAPHQIGVARVAGDIVIDLFGSAALYERGWKKVVRGMLLDAGTNSSRPGTATERVASALYQLQKASPTISAAVGAGHTVHADHDGNVLGACVCDGKVYHSLAGVA